MSSEAEARNAGVARPSGTPPPGILVIDDDENLTRLLRESLEEAGYDVLSAGNGVDGMRELYAGRPDLVVLDVMMPRLDGWATLSRIREMSDVPVVMLSARDAESDRLRGFELGVDDYVTKPFSLRELKSRIRSLLRRRSLDQGVPEDEFRDHRLTVRRQSMTVELDGTPVRLTRREFELLWHLIACRPRVASRESILERVWGLASEVETRTVDVHVRSLRAKLAAEMIETVIGAGYRFRGFE
jgi:DNA-binding response OmpR family regulator